MDKDYSVLISVGRQDELELVITDRQRSAHLWKKAKKQAALQVKLDGETLDTQILFIAEDVDKANFSYALSGQSFPWCAGCLTKFSRCGAGKCLFYAILFTYIKSINREVIMFSQLVEIHDFVEIMLFQ